MFLAQQSAVTERFAVMPDQIEQLRVKMMVTAVYSTKPHDREFLLGGAEAGEVTWRFHEFSLSTETAPAARGAVAVCLFVNDRADRACLTALAEVGVKMIALRCAGYNNLDVEAAQSLGMTVVRVPAYSPHAVAEYTLGLLLTLNRKIHRAYNRVREMNFSLDGLVGFDLKGKTVGIVGTGNVGRVAAEILCGFGTTVIAHDVDPRTEWATAHGIQYVDFDTLLAQSDVISLHVPLLPATRHLLNQESLARMKSGVFIVNTSRGKLIDTAALIASLKTGHVGGVALDVYEEEEGIFYHDLSGQVLQDDELSRLLTFPNVLVTSHQAFLTREALTEIARVTTRNLLLHAAGKPLLQGTTL